MNSRDLENVEWVMASSDLKLRIELVPQPLRMRSLHKMLPKQIWERIRKSILAAHAYKCAICGVGGRLHCHEVWEYNDDEHVQKLVDLIAICEMCHEAKHLGLTFKLEDQDRLKKIVGHFLRVNKCSREDLLSHRAEAIAKYEERSEHVWKQDFGEYEYLRPVIDRKRELDTERQRQLLLAQATRESDKERLRRLYGISEYQKSFEDYQEVLKSRNLLGVNRKNENKEGKIARWFRYLSRFVAKVRA